MVSIPQGAVCGQQRAQLQSLLASLPVLPPLPSSLQQLHQHRTCNCVPVSGGAHQTDG